MNISNFCLKKFKNIIFDPFLKKFVGQTFSLQNNRNSDWDRQSSGNCPLQSGKISEAKTTVRILSFDHFGGPKKQKCPEILKLKLARRWPRITLLEHKN